MLLITTRTNKGNLVLCTAFTAAAVAVVALEGYITSVDVWFALFGAGVFVGALFSSARFLSTKRWLALVSVSGGMGLLTQYIGVSVGAWHYTNPAGTYVFVFFAFGLGSLWNYAVATLLASYALPRKLHHPAVGPVLVGVTLLATIAL